MKINGTDVSAILAADLAYSAMPEHSVGERKTYALKYHQHAVSIYESTDLVQTGTLGTLKNPLAPSAPRAGLKTWKIAIAFRSDSQSLFRKATSDLVAACAAKEAEYEFDGLEHHFRGVLTGYEAEELVPRRLYKVTLSVLGREIGELVEYEFTFPRQVGSGSVGTISNAGTAPSPAMVIVQNLHAQDINVSISGLLRDPVSLVPKEYEVGWGKFKTFEGYSYGFGSVNHVMDGRRGLDAVYNHVRKVDYYKAGATYEARALHEFTTANAHMSGGPSHSRSWIVPISSYGVPVFMPGETELTYSAVRIKPGGYPGAGGKIRVYTWPCYL